MHPWAFPQGGVVFRSADPILHRGGLGPRWANSPFANSKAFSIAGGGDTVAAVNQFDVADRIDYVSTAGGAKLAKMIDVAWMLLAAVVPIGLAELQRRSEPGLTFRIA